MNTSSCMTALLAMHYMTYAHLQLARDNEARRVVDQAPHVSGHSRFNAYYALAAMPARYVIKRGD